MEFTDILWGLFGLFFIGATLAPALRKQLLNRARLGKLRKIQEKRGSRAITLIHRQETVALLGIPIVEYMDIDDSEQVLRAIRKSDPDVPIDLILHTPGGLMLAGEQIAYALSAHPAKVTVIVPHYAMSGGTLVALAANEILIDANAVLGPVDPSVKNLPAASILQAVARKDDNEVDDETLILADVGQKAIRQVKQIVVRLVSDRMGQEKAEKLAEILATGTWTHDYPITAAEAAELGLPVATELPEEVFDLMELYPQSTQKRPSVQYVPVSPKEGDKGEATRRHIRY